ncbi:hypothetical protein ACLOJK_004872, partial [Asimina triloba]
MLSPFAHRCCPSRAATTTSRRRICHGRGGSATRWVGGLLVLAMGRCPIAVDRMTIGVINCCPFCHGPLPCRVIQEKNWEKERASPVLLPVLLFKIQLK